jgi:hypothetical protein
MPEESHKAAPPEERKQYDSLPVPPPMPSDKTPAEAAAAMAAATAPREPAKQ